MDSGNARIKGPGVWSFHKNVLGNPALYFHTLMNEFGDIVRCRSVNELYLISHPEYARTIFQHYARYLNKNDEVNARLKSVIGDGVVVTSGDIWRAQRHRAQVIFKKKEINRFSPLIANQSEVFARKLSKVPNTSWELQEQLSQHLLSVLLKCLFNEEDALIKSELAEAFASGYEFVGKASFINLPNWIPFTKNNKLIRSSRKMDDVIATIQKQQTLTNRYEGTLLAHLMQFKNEDGSSLTPTEVTAEVKNILAAGHFSTTDLLCWMIYTLAKYPEWQVKIREELSHVEDKVDFQGVPSLQYFIHEVMRCYPPVWSSWHKTQHEIQLNNYTIPANKTIIISFFNIHRNPACWTNPDEFEPLRFANGTAKPEYFMPFGFGQRKCLGMGLATSIINQTITHLVLNAELKLDPSLADPVIQSRVTLGSKDRLRILISPLR